MKIGWLKCGQNLYFDPDLVEDHRPARVSMRVRLFKALLRHGVEIRILSPISPRHWLAYKELAQEFDGLREGSGTKDLDALVVECGPQGSLGTFKFVAQVAKVIKDYEGLVMYFEHDPTFGMLMNMESLSPTYHKNFGIPAKVKSTDLTKNKVWIVLTQAFKTEEFIKRYSTSRSPYKKLKIPGVTYTIAPLSIETEYSPRLHPKHDFVYCNNYVKYSHLSYPSIDDFVSILRAYRDGPVIVYGQWPEEIQERMRKNVEFKGGGDPGKQAELVNDAKCTMLMGGDNVCETATLSGRYYEHVCGGAVVILDSRFKWFEDHYGLYLPHVPAELILENNDELEATVSGICAMSYDERKSLWKKQRDGFMHLRKSSSYATQLEKIVDAWTGANGADQHERHKEFIGNYMEELAKKNPEKAKLIRKGYK